MAFAETTLASACGANDKTIVLASATSVVAGRRFIIDGEEMQATKDYVSGVTVGVIRGQNGTAQAPHPTGVRVTHGDGSDWGNPGQGSATNYPVSGLTYEKKSVGTGTAVVLDLPKAGTHLLINLVGAAGTFTMPVPTKELDGCRVLFTNDTAAAHAITFTGGLGGVGATADVATFKADQKQSFEVVAMNETWQSLGGIVAGAATIAGVGIA